MPKSVNLENAYANLRRMSIPVHFSTVEKWVLAAEIRPTRAPGRMAGWLARLLQNTRLKLRS